MTLYKEMLRVAKANPELRSELVPILRRYAASSAEGQLQTMVTKARQMQKDPKFKDIKKGLDAIAKLVGEIADYAGDHDI